MTTIVHMADLHFGSEDVEAIGVAAEAIHDLTPDAIIVSGDLTQRGKRREFRACSSWLSQFEVPQLVTAGNHDTPLLDVAARVTAPFDRFHDHFAEKTKPLDLTAVRCAQLNSARGWQVRSNWAEGSINLRHLASTLAAVESDDEKLSLITCHHPFLSPPGAKMVTRTTRGQRASELLAKSKVKVLLSGHVHTPSVQEWHHDGGAYLAVSCGTLSTRTRSAPPSFNVLKISGRSLTVDAVSIEDRTIRVDALKSHAI
jgi:3',5'-cyclic AMP phosphodiesterase CpdA